MVRRLSRPSRPRGPRLTSIELRDVGVRRGRRWVLRDVAFTLRAGERWLVTGANGAGKTVLLKLLRGDLWPTPTGREHRLYRLGSHVDRHPLEARARIAYLGPERQDKYERHEWDHTVGEVVGTGLFDTDIPLDRIDAAGRRAVRDVLQQAKLAGLPDRRFLSLSYGQRRRVLLARALVRRPDVLLLDEALNGLDATSRRAFLRQLSLAADERMAWVLTTHRELDRPAGITHVARLSGGMLVAAGPVPGDARGEGAARPQLGTRPGSERIGRDHEGSTGSRRGERALAVLRDATVYRGPRRVISKLDWTLAAGEHWCVTGPNGSGKSTFIALLFGDLWPAHGGFIERPMAARAAPIETWKRAVGLVSPELQSRYAATDCTVEEIVVSGLHASIGLNEQPAAREIALARAALRRVGLAPLRARRARQLSYGQLRLALLARALVRPRRLLLLDEPFDGLDAAAVALTRRLLQESVRRGAQLVIASHHAEDVPDCVRNTLEFGRAGRWRIISRDAAAAPPRARRVRRAKASTASP